MSNEDEQRARQGAGARNDEQRGGTGAASGPQDGGPTYSAYRYTRRRMLVLGGALIAGVAAVVAGLRAFGGTATEKVGTAITDQFGPFPVRSVESVPDVPPGEWVVKVDGLVVGPITLDRSMWSSLQRTTRLPTSTAWRAGAWTMCAGAEWRHPFARPGRCQAPGQVRRLPRQRRGVLEQPAAGPGAGRSDRARRLAQRCAAAAQARRPLRLVVPKQLGYKSVKWVERIELRDEIETGYWESNGYTDDAPVGG